MATIDSQIRGFIDVDEFGVSVVTGDLHVALTDSLKPLRVANLPAVYETPNPSAS
jgi:hypothetical protein